MSTFGSASGIVAGQAFVEVGADTSKMQQQIIDGITKALNSSSGGIGTNLSVLRQLGEARWLDRGLSSMNQLVAEAVKLKEQFEDGDISAGEMVDKLAGMVPFLGQAWQLGRNIKELFTGIAEEADRIAKAGQNVADSSGAIASISEVRTKARDEQGNTLQHLREEGAVIGQTGPQREWSEAQINLFNGLKDLNEKTNTQLKALAEAQKYQIDVPGPNGKTTKADVLLSTRERDLEKALRGGSAMLNSVSDVDMKKIVIASFLPSKLGGPIIESTLKPYMPSSHNMMPTQEVKMMEAELKNITTAIASLKPAKNEINAGADAIREQLFANFFKSGEAIAVDFWDKFKKGASEAMDKSEEEIKKMADEQAEAARKRAEQLKETGAARFDLARSLETPAERLKEVTKELDQLLAHHIIGGQEYKKALDAINQDFGGKFDSRGVENSFALQSIMPTAAGTETGGVKHISEQIDRLMSMLSQGMQFN